jgi:phosphoribosylamine--glycine ligase
MTPNRTQPRRSPRVGAVGKDARTDALIAKCVESPQNPELWALSELRSPGYVRRCRDVFIGSLVDTSFLIRVLRDIELDLAIIGPEEPLAAGYVDILRARGIPTFGPTKRVARIESSKSWARELVDRHDIAGNPEYRIFTSLDGLEGYLEELQAFVVKPDGLTAGKGVRVFGEHLHSIDDALAYAQLVLATDRCVVIEERLDGEEFSLQTITDGETVIHCPAVQDHKRARENDSGPNTGGMGSYSCGDFSLPFLDPTDLAAAQRINEQVIDALARETGERYCGVLYGGFMVTAAGLRLIEYNCRFGDPEALNVLPLLQADFVELCMAAAVGKLGTAPYSFAPKATVCKYVVPAEYPESRAERALIEVPESLHDRPDLKWYWAACEQDGDDIYLSSSRAGAFVGIGDSLAEAEALAESAAASVLGPVRHRQDIGTAEAVERRVRHMNLVRSGAHRSESVARAG